MPEVRPPTSTGLARAVGARVVVGYGVADDVALRLPETLRRPADAAHRRFVEGVGHGPRAAPGYNAGGEGSFAAPVPHQAAFPGIAQREGRT